MRRSLAVLLSILVAATGVALVAAGPAGAATLVRQRLRYAIKHLPVAAQTPAGYERAKFRLWVDADGDCQDTRAEVLVAESAQKTTGGCTIKTGSWFSYYDRQSFAQASGLDIDHLVPLAEAWRSGAKRWDAGTRQRYANDLGDRRTLVAVSAHTNRSKGDQDPAQWLPQYGRCTYVGQWVAVKLRWRLKVDAAEKAALLRQAGHCANTVIRVRRARVTTGQTSGQTSGSGGLDPQFDTCTAAKAAGYGPYYQGTDPEYDWYTDADGDGIVCE